MALAFKAPEWAQVQPGRVLRERVLREPQVQAQQTAPVPRQVPAQRPVREPVRLREPPVLEKEPAQAGQAGRTPARQQRQQEE